MHSTAEGRRARASSATNMFEGDEASEHVRLFVGCLPDSVTAEELRPIFEVYGNIVDVEIATRAAASSGRTGFPLNYAFVRFEASCASLACEAAVAQLHGLFYCGDMPLPMQVRVLPEAASPTKLFVAGFPLDAFVASASASEAASSGGGQVATSLGRHLAMQYGPVSDVHVLSKNHNYNLQANSLAAFVTFLCRSSAEQFIQDACMHVLLLPDGEVAQATVRASFALAPTSSSPDSPAAKFNQQNTQSQQSQQAQQAQNGVYLSQKQRVLRVATPLPLTVDLSPVKLFVGCLPYSKTASEVAGVFGQYGPLLEVAVLTDVEGKSKGAAFVTFACKENADEALQRLAGFVFPGSTRPINVSLAHRQQSPLANASSDTLANGTCWSVNHHQPLHSTSSSCAATSAASYAMAAAAAAAAATCCYHPGGSPLIYPSSYYSAQHLPLPVPAPAPAVAIQNRSHSHRPDDSPLE